MDVVKKDVESLVTKELKNALKNNPLFHSLHEGYAVILEEVDEVKTELEIIDTNMDGLWCCTKNDDRVFCLSRAQAIKSAAIRAAVESIQVAVMAQKFLDSEANF